VSEPSNAPAASVLVCTYNGRESLLRTLDSLEQQSACGSFEIVVAVDGSTDGTIEALEARRSTVPLRCVSQENRGAASARNAAARLSRGNVLIFLDDDQLADGELVAAHLAAHERQPAALVQGICPLAPESVRRGAALAYELTRLGGMASRNGAKTPWHLWGGNFSIDRATWLAVGEFDESFRIYGGEDEDFGLRAQELGVPVVLEPRALSHHLYGITYRGFRRYAFSAGRSAVRVSRKHHLPVDSLPGASMRPVDRIIGKAWRINPAAIAFLGTVATGGLWLVDQTRVRPLQLTVARLVRRWHYVGGVSLEEARKLDGDPGPV
jgi:glycosyltransferase involved in cell wall biosynthesis